jgi:hypothetical protein
MSERLKKIRQEKPNFDKKMVDKFAEKMPELLEVMLDGELYDDHIGDKKTALLAEKFITNNKGENIGFKWDYETIMNIAQSYVNLNQEEFYPTDLWVWANVKYGDMSHIVNDINTIIRYAISELTDEDFPFYEASKRAYYWLKKHIENNS